MRAYFVYFVFGPVVESSRSDDPNRDKAQWLNTNFSHILSLSPSSSFSNSCSPSPSSSSPPSLSTSPTAFYSTRLLSNPTHILLLSTMQARVGASPFRRFVQTVTSCVFPLFRPSFCASTNSLSSVVVVSPSSWLACEVHGVQRNLRTFYHV